MSKLQKYESIIKEKRKNTPFRVFLKEIASRYNLNLYKRDTMITPYNPDFKWKLVNLEEFENLRLDYDKLWKDYDFNIDFWENYRLLAGNIHYPAFALWWVNENSNYGYNILNVKNWYLCFEVCFCENVAYSANIKDNCKNVFNSLMVWDNSENIYQSVWIYKSYNVFYSNFIFDSNNIWFSTNLIWCNECLFCNDLQNQSYCIKNKNYSKDEYIKLKNEIFSAKKVFLELYKKLQLNNSQLISKNSSWKFIIKSDNVENWNFIYNVNNGRNVMFAWTIEWNVNFFDAASCWSPRGNDYYWVISAWAWDNYFCSTDIIWWTNIYYSYYLENCSFCLGCIWLKNKTYCILNKEYSKEEWYEIADKIFAQMDKGWILWDFFPWDLNPFYFNDTVAYLLDDSFTKEEVIKDWHLWRDEKIKADISEWVEVIEAKNLDITNYDESILEKVILDSDWNYYRIIKMEYDFLKKYNLPLPETHWMDRIKLGFRFNR
ncbi:MAG: hypothetical protein ACD_4C00428G0001 [uncultured bacterium (gcode 4)]|uniref:Uncharacterized protein n=1 Tax=uncultured bacterium (gcode 4) TaxID=1234023 RepID=K2F4X0_9BACT|nr:MAG: hypothetical protein ACD_4C00428G0001 [uncultured bacterium (gcode 4)]